jgi:hypothetical protein
MPIAETSSEPSMRRCVLNGRELVAEDPAVPVCARTAERGSKDAAAIPRPATINLRRSGIAGPPVPASWCFGCSAAGTKSVLRVMTFSFCPWFLVCIQIKVF